MQIPFGTNEWGSEDQQIADIKLRNMYLAENPLSPDGISRYMRPSLAQLATIGTGPIRGIWRQDGTLAGDLLVVSGDELYRYIPGGEATLIGSVPGVLTCQFAGTIDDAVVVSDYVAYLTDGTTVSPIAMPDDDPVGSVAQIDSVYLLSVAEFFRFYWMNPGETSPDPLNFASAERLPDPIVSINVISDEIWMLGSDSVEVWTQTGDQDAPYARITGRAYTEGCVHRDSTAEAAVNGFPCLLWVTNYAEVVLAQGNPVKVSNDAVEEILRRATNIRGWTFRRLRVDFYVITTEDQTLVYNLDMKSWMIWSSYGLDVWRSHLGAQDRQDIYAGDYSTGKIYRLGEAAHDADDQPIVCAIRGFVPLSGKQERCASVNIRANQGWGPSYVTAPIIELLYSDDYGFTWSEPRQKSMGLKGRYFTDITFRSLGLIQRPGRMFEVRFSGLEKFRIDYATMNEV